MNIISKFLGLELLSKDRKNRNKRVNLLTQRIKNRKKHTKTYGKNDNIFKF